MIIIIPFSGGVTHYLADAQNWFDHINDACPECNHKTHRNGHYRRTVSDQSEPFIIPIFRRYCPECNVSFSYFPSFLKPYARFLNSYRFDVIHRYVIEKVSLNKTLCSSSLKNLVQISVTTFRRWLKRFKELAPEINKRLMQHLFELEPGLSPPSGHTDMALVLKAGQTFLTISRKLTGEFIDSTGVFDLLNLFLPASLWV